MQERGTGIEDCGTGKSAAQGESRSAEIRGSTGREYTDGREESGF